MDKREKVKAYIASALPLLNLRQWTVNVSNSLPPDDSFADVEVSTHLYQATIRLSEDFWKETPTSQRRIIAHELIHVHYAGVERMIENIEESVGTIVYDLLDRIYDVECERAADSLSVPLGELLPLPDFLEKEGKYASSKNRKH